MDPVLTQKIFESSQSPSWAFKWMNTAQRSPWMSMFNLPTAQFIVFPSRRRERCKSGFSLHPAFLVGTGSSKSPGDAAEWINSVSSLLPRALQRNFALSKAQSLTLRSWKKVNAARATQQQPVHKHVVKYLQGLFISTLLKHKYVFV